MNLPDQFVAFEVFLLGKEYFFGDKKESCIMRDQTESLNRVNIYHLRQSQLLVKKERN